jgi:FKBP-type peptidyl-prolyl cis-trans isomerase FkpA
LNLNLNRNIFNGERPGRIYHDPAFYLLYLLKLVKYCSIPNKRLFLCNMLKSKILLLFIAAACSFAACKTEPAYDRAAQAAIDDDLIKKFIADSNIVATPLPSGLYYKVIKQGTGSGEIKYDDTDTIMMRYVGKMIPPNDNILYDSTQVALDSLAPKFIYNTTIIAWQEGLKYIRPGGTIRLIVPSTLAYQNRVVSAAPGPNGIARFLPANTILDFNIKLISVKKFVPPTTTGQ